MNDVIKIENTRFIFNTNFAGDPAKDRFRSPQRKGNIIIPSEFAQDFINAGFNIKKTKPGPDDGEEFEPTFYTSILVNYNTRWPPAIYLVAGNSEPVLLDAETVGQIDDIRVKNVNVLLNPHEWEDGWTLYVRTMYVEQYIDDDPFASRYNRS